jgi:UDP-N-acetylglucosamine 1-carboxyvinyltransferase
VDKFIIKGGNKLSGQIKVSGAKNASLALMPAAILTSGETILYNTPELNDVYTMERLLSNLGAVCEFRDEVMKINTSGLNTFTAPYELVKKMRASVYVLGPLLARFGQAKYHYQGGVHGDHDPLIFTWRD